MSNPISAVFPEKLQFLFVPKRFKVCWGGRGAGRSWNFARALLLMGMQEKLSVLCVREFQNSIEESVHKVLKEQIILLGLEAFYTVEKAKIYGPNGTSFVFEGIRNNTARIKSYEGMDICWAEEAVKLTKSSWNILIPTIRKAGSEIWITYNPELEEDYTHERFVLDPELTDSPTFPGSGVKESEHSFVVKMNYHDNPWFAETAMYAQMLLDKKNDPDMYLNVWEGHCRVVLEGVVYAKEIRRAIEENRICAVPYEEEIPVDTFWDLGRGDQTAIWFVQRVAMQYRVIDFVVAAGEDMPYFIKALQNKRYLYGRHYLPHDAKAKKLGQPKTIQGILATVYPGMVQIVPKYSRADGINAARMIFKNCWFDAKKCKEGLRALKHYRYEVKDGQLSNDPKHDWASDGADAFRYMAVTYKVPMKRKSLDEKLSETRDILSSATSGIGQLWMGH